MLALLYQLGLGLSQDVEQAVSWYERAAVQGHAIAWANLGQIYGSGLLGQPNTEKARYCYAKAWALGGPGDARYGSCSDSLALEHDPPT
jgi:TPR repeat protein